MSDDEIFRKIQKEGTKEMITWFAIGLPLCVASAYISTVLNKKFLNDHPQKAGDDICSKCKRSCGKPASTEKGYGNRSNMVKYTYYCNNCGRYYSIWR